MVYIGVGDQNDQSNLLYGIVCSVIFSIMDGFALNNEFQDYESIINAKKAYELASNTLLTVTSSKFLIGESELKRKVKYSKIEYGCKAGVERKSRSNGIRASSTYKKGCEVKARAIAFN